MKRVRYEVEFVTPCFLGGANNRTTAEWRAPSIRGQLRWWFRALAGGATKGLQAEVARLEGEVFGTTERTGAVRILVTAPEGGVPTEKFGRAIGSTELVRICRGETEPNAAQRLKIERHGREVNSNPVSYLGYGAINFRGESEKSYIPAGAKGRILLEVVRPIREDLAGLLNDATWCWLNLGGIGSKSRKGYGSIGLLSCSSTPPIAGGLGVSPTPDAKTFCEKASFLKERYGNAHGLPEWSHFSSGSSIWLSLSEAPTWMGAMELAGSWLVGFRRRYGMAGDRRPGLANRDYEWAYRSDGELFRHGYPDKAGFGLPLPFGSTGETVAWGAYKENRRASPLLMHIGKFGNGHRVVMTHIPARLVPTGERLKFKGNPHVGPEPTPEQNAIVERYLGELASRKLMRRVDNVG